MTIAIDLFAGQHNRFGVSNIAMADMTKVLGDTVIVAVVSGFGFMLTTDEHKAQWFFLANTATALSVSFYQL